MAEPVHVNRKLHASWPLPEPGSDKDGRGTILVVGGSATVPGAILLAAEAALRAGAGKLQVATTNSVAASLAVSLPEALVTRTPEADSGDIAAEAADSIVELAESASAVLLGPGITNPEKANDLLARIVPRLGAQRVVVDALASAHVTEQIDCLHHLESWPVMTLNPTEVAHTLHIEKEEVERDPLAATLDLASKARAVVLCGGEDKFIANPDGDTWWVSVGGPGLGVSGSGDVQAGIVAGLVARGAAPEQAAAFGGWLHGSSGDALSRSVGPLGFLARELPGEVPGLLAELASAGAGA